MKKMNFKSAGITLALGVTLLFGCSKSSKFTPTPTKGGGTTTAYTDPAQYGTPYSSMPATKDVIMYEVNINTFPGANFQGVEGRLDSIKALGVNVIWLMPTYPIGTDSKSVGSPYCVKDFQGVNASFGTLADLRTLVAQAHALGMAVILDWEANDTSWDNIWTTETTYDASIGETPSKSWYQLDGSGNIEQFSTYTDVAALNFNNNDMRIAIIRSMKYWVYSANIDGFRCDDADATPSDFWTQALDTLNNITTHKLMFLAEGTQGSEITDGFQLGYAFSYYTSLNTLFAGSSFPSAIFTTNSQELASLPSPGIKLRYITNHDDANTVSTISEYNGKQGALAAFVIAAYMDGVPLIYSSQEVGYASAINFFNVVPVDYTANPDMVAAYKQIIAFRTAHEAIKTGTLTQYNDANVVAFEKTSGTDDVVVLVNVKNSTVTYTAPAALQTASYTNAFAGGSISLAAPISLSPYSYLVLTKN